jgi:Pumilio-family RNA binding repeat
MSKEQHGCRYLQRLLASASGDDIQTLLDDILPHTGELMIDPFGNYLIQKVLDVCSSTQRRAVLECACKAGLPEIACNAHGTRAAQKLVEAVRCHVWCFDICHVVFGAARNGSGAKGQC